MWNIFKKKISPGILAMGNYMKKRFKNRVFDEKEDIIFTYKKEKLLCCVESGRHRNYVLFELYIRDCLIKLSSTDKSFLENIIGDVLRRHQARELSILEKEKNYAKNLTKLLL